MNKSNPKFLISAKKVFLTFPKANPDITHDLLHSNIKAKHSESELESIVTAKEFHQNQETHFHIFIAFKKKKTIRNSKYFDYILNKHGNYQSVKSTKNTLNYLHKTNDTLTWGKDFHKPSNEQLTETLINFAKTQNNLENIFDENNLELEKLLWKKPTQTIQFHKLHQSHIKHKNQRKLRKLFAFDLQFLKHTFDRPEFAHLQPFYKQILPILVFLNQHINNRRYKSLNLLLYSHLPSLGKSSLFNLLQSQVPTMQFPMDLWFENYVQNQNQIIIFDELSFTGITPEFIKNFLAGANIQLAKKGSSVLKLDNPIVLMAANNSLRQLVKKKMNFTCNCKESKLDDLVLCNNTILCKPSKPAESFYLALKERIKVFHLEEHIFPINEHDWNTYEQILSSSMTFQDNAG